MGAIKAKKTTTKSKSSLGSKLKGAVSSLGSFGTSAKRTTGRRRGRRGPNYWANKVLVEKLKRRYNRLKYGGVR